MIFGSFVTIPLSLLFIFIWNYLYSGLNQQFYTSCILFGLGAALETYGEPFLVKSILQFDYSVQAKAESLSLFIKTIVLYILESNKSTFHSTLINFGISEVVRGLVFALISIYYRQSDSMNYIPEQIQIKQNNQQPYYIHKKIKAIGLEFTILSFFKLLLQEIEKIFLINVKNDAFVNAEYTLISHLGSIIPRFIFQPLEEIAYNLFAKISQTNESTEEQVQQAKVKNASQLQKIITILLQLVIIIGSFAIVFGIPVSKDILHLLYGEKWSSHVIIASFFLAWFLKVYLNEFRYILQQKNKISINDEKQIGQDQEENQSLNSKNTLIE
ncbi:hypothetical protein PPERSA_00817 [Pseudocohnilembus persalinus]|uniref:Protein RFT1 homolog n=1 Tax=Pseudocohnilembus persalinus TaxID=266149 RepID=A0A0V0QFT3_PSEPJ|nr:hypothetical protein PPERSA_00817 [Pseudocohnilembus persalinus]|eukprot:KRX01069.1 hypothetical protein PPERSA_00817 [Pseudocohnilembus persalinus]